MRHLCCALFLVSSAFAEISLKVGGKNSEFEEALVECELQGRFLIRHLKLTFRNDGTRRTEGDLTCPLDEGEEIVSFAMDVNGVRREGVVVPSKKGSFAYETIVARGVDPGLIEVNEVTNEFRTRVFPIPARGIKQVWITTVQVVTPGEVDVWPKGLGNPKKWELKILAVGGGATSFEKIQQGGGNDLPDGRTEWKPSPGLAYRSDHGDIHFAKKEIVELKAETLEVWLDGSTKISPVVKDRLVELLALYQNAKVSLRVFREEVGKAQEFVLVNGKTNGLLAAISKTPYMGMARPQMLPWKSVEADAVILISDGTYATGRGSVGEIPCPLHVIDSGKGTSRWLRHQALKSGGGWHSPANLDPWLERSLSGATLVGEVMEELLFVKPAESAIKTSIANWLWARLQSQEMNDRGVGRKEIDDFNFRHGVMDSSSSMIVMETARQYQEFGIEPPKEDLKLYQEWEGLKKNEKDVQVQNLKGLAELWKKRCDHLSTPVPPLSERVLTGVEDRQKQLEGIMARSKDVNLATVHPLMTELLAIKGLAAGGFDEGEIPQVKEHLDSVTQLESKIKLKFDWVRVTVGGQVRRAGQVFLPPTATLWGAVKAAGGETPFGATNRVKLYRNGKVYTYNLKINKHKSVRLYFGDLVEVPQKNWMGNGGGGGRKTAPFSKEAPSAIAFEKGDSQPPKYYLDALSKVIDDEEKWPIHYQAFRAACGWKADFYLNLIHLLEDRGEKEMALRVAADLAEHMPEKIEVLRRAARAIRRLGDLKSAHEIFEYIYQVEPYDAIAMYDLARVKQDLGQAKEAVILYWEAAKIAGSQYTLGRSVVILEELNALLAKEQMDASEFGIDPRFVRHVPLELRAVLEWDADQSNVDLIIRDPTGKWMIYYAGDKPEPSIWWSGNVSRGYGPEGWALQGLLPGTYHFGARFYGDWNHDGISTATAEVEFTRNFGTPEETREVHALRVEEKTQVEIVKAKVLPKGWE